MNETLKNILYDWGGFNKWLFLQINSLHGDLYDDTMLIISDFGDYHNFPYYLGALFLWALIWVFIRMVTRRGGVKFLITGWIAVVLMLGVGFVAERGTVNALKDHFAYPRPYLVFGKNEVHVIDYNALKPKDDHRSFPSGHASFATLLVVTLWPILPVGTGWLGVLLIIGVCWSRIAMGVHFPADVLGGVIITFILISLLRVIIYPILRKIGLRC